jgi:hypothetical protein
MASLELRFCQERGEDGQLTYRLEPYAAAVLSSFPTADWNSLTDLSMSLLLTMGNELSILPCHDMPFVTSLQEKSVDLKDFSLYADPFTTLIDRYLAPGERRRYRREG